MKLSIFFSFLIFSQLGHAYATTELSSETQEMLYFLELEEMLGDEVLVTKLNEDGYLVSDRHCASYIEDQGEFGFLVKAKNCHRTMRAELGALKKKYKWICSPSGAGQQSKCYKVEDKN